MAKIVFNGQEYDSPEAMPPEVRQLYQMAAQVLADKDRDGLPDIFAGGTAATSSSFTQSTQFIVDGKVYTSLDELPAEAREKYQQVMRRFDADGNGVPDVLEGSLFSATTQASAPPPAAPAYQEPRVQVLGEMPLGARWLLIGTAILLLAIAAFYLLSR